MGTNKKLKLGLVGLGLWGQNYIRVIKENRLSTLQGCADLNIKVVNEIKDSFPNINASCDYNELLRNSNIDAMIVATPSKDHYRIAKDCMLFGKHVLVEKPMALSVGQCEDLITIAQKNNLVLMVGHIFRFNSAVCKIKELIDFGELGELFYFYSTRTGLGPVRNDVNVLWDLAPHDFSILLYLINTKPTSIIAQGASYLNKKIDDVVFSNIKFEANKLANVHVSWLDTQKTRRITLVGSKKMVIFDDVSVQEKIRICDKGIGYHQVGINFGEFQSSVRDGDVIIPKIKSNEPLREEFDHFVECVLEHKQPITDGKNGLEVVRLLEAAQKSLDENRIVEL